MSIMMVGSEFPGDNNKTLMHVQHDLYGEMVVRLFTVPRDRYLAAARLLRVETELSERLKNMDGFDQRTQQLAHDRIAAYFRFARDDGGQLELGEDEEGYRRRLETGWREFLCEELEKLVTDDGFTLAVLTAAAYGNTESGHAAEKWLDELLKERYRASRRTVEPNSLFSNGF